MKKKNNLNQLYKYPLPVNARPQPPVVLHNPLSVLYYIWDYMFPSSEGKICCHGEISDDGRFVKITSEKDMDILWSMGFFGKGILSRSEPTWYIRTARRLNLKGGDKITAEDITEARRLERKKFKQNRAKDQERELAERRAKDDPSYLVPHTSHNDNGNNAGSSSSLRQDENEDKDQASAPRAEDEEIIENGELVQQEYLQLSPEETIFLTFGLGALKVGNMDSTQLIERFLENDPHFLYKYVAYHHYRSKGWCVKNGVKFGTDLLLYKRGPPFSHADFAVLIMPVGTPAETQTWWWNTNIGRVIGGAKKTAVFCYVHIPSGPETGPICIDQILKHSFVREVVYRRWIPARNRD